MKKHKSFQDFPNADAAKRHLKELRARISDMQRKLGNAHYKAKAYKHFSDPGWLHRLGVALDCHKQEAMDLEAEILAHERKVRRKTADFYWHFYNAARAEMTRETFDRASTCARISMEAEGK